MSLPSELLNRVNTELTAKVQKAATDLARTKQLLKMNEEVLRETAQQLANAKTQYSALQTVLERNAEIRKTEEERLAVAKRQAEKSATMVKDFQNKIADMMKKVTVTDDQLGKKRGELKEVEDTRSQMEEVMLAWLADNAVTGEATAMADGEMKSASAIVKRLQSQADGLTVKIKLVEDGLWEEALATEQVRSEVDGTRQQKDALVSEVLNIKNQLEQLSQRGTSVDEQQLFLQQQFADNERRILEEKSRRDVLRKEVSEAEAETQKTLQLRSQHDTLKGRHGGALANARSAAKEEERRCEEIEIQIRVTREESRRLAKQKDDLLEHLSILTVRTQRYTAKLAALTAQYEDAMKAMHQGDGSDDCVNVELMQRQLAKELMELDSALLRGQHLLQQRRRDMMITASAAEETTETYAQLQRHVMDARTKQHGLSNALHNLTIACASIDEETSSVGAQLQLEKARLSEASVAIKREYQSRIQQLRDELQNYEKINLQAKKSVEAAQASMRAQARGLGAEKDLLSSLEEEKNATSREINAIISELDQLAVEKERIGSAAEGLHWQVEAMRQQAEGIKGELFEKFQHQEQMELAMKEHEGAVKASIDGLLVAYHAHQEERTRMGVRFNTVTQRCKLMQSRYEDMMSALTRKVYGPDGVEVSVSAPPLAITSKLDSSSSVPVADPTVTPEELQAHMMLQRAQERDALLQKGDALDAAIVAAEKDLRQLNNAITRMQAAYSEGRALVREGHDVDTVLYGHAPLLLAPQPSQEEEELMRFVTQRLAEDEEKASREAVAAMDQHVKQLDGDLAACKAQEERVKASLGSVSQRLSAVKATCSAKQRHLAEIARECEKDNSLSDKARKVAFIKQSSLLKHNKGTLAFATVATQDRLSEASRHLVSLASSRGPECFYALRKLTDKFGLNLDANAFSPFPTNVQYDMAIVSPTLLSTVSVGKGVGTRSSSAVRPSASSAASAHRPSIASLDPNVAPQRTATKALVQQYVQKQQAHQEHLSSYVDPMAIGGTRMPSSSARAHSSRKATVSSARASSLQRK